MYIFPGLHLSVCSFPFPFPFLSFLSFLSFLPMFLLSISASQLGWSISWSMWTRRALPPCTSTVTRGGGVNELGRPALGQVVGSSDLERSAFLALAFGLRHPLIRKGAFGPVGALAPAPCEGGCGGPRGGGGRHKDAPGRERACRFTSRRGRGRRVKLMDVSGEGDQVE